MTAVTDTAGVGFRCGVDLHAEDDQILLVSENRSAFRLRKVHPSLRRALQELSERPQLAADVGRGLDARTATQLHRVLARVKPYLAPHVLHEGRTLLSVEALAADASYEPAVLTRDDPVRLSKFTLARRRHDALVLESPATKYRVVLRDRTVRALVNELGQPATAASLADGLPEPAVLDVLAHLVGAGFVDRGEPTGQDETPHFPIDDDVVVRQWELADLYLHARSRTGRTDEPFGGRFPYRGEIDPLPPVKQPPDGERIALPRPALDDILTRDPALVTAMEARQSVRAYGEQPITLAQVAEFLYRVARVRGTYGPRAERGMPYPASSRPFPCGGAGYELELYLTVRRCAGLEPDSYFYDPAGHQLVRLHASEPDRTALHELATLSTGGIATPDVLITVTSRFQRLSWKYQSIAYAVTLKHVGVLYQTMYLVATAMGLAGCGLGSGDADLSARAFGLDYLVESGVGEFILGSAPEQPTIPETEKSEADWHDGNDPQWQAESRARLAVAVPATE